MADVATQVPIPSPDEIKRIRLARGLTQEAAAEKAGCSQGVWSAWEKGLRRPSRQSALLIDLIRRKII